ncbi:uncharacterized protein AB9W97_017506 [Spinachia spinachia]
MAEGEEQQTQVMRDQMLKRMTAMGREEDEANRLRRRWDRGRCWTGWWGSARWFTLGSHNLQAPPRSRCGQGGRRTPSRSRRRRRGRRPQSSVERTTGPASPSSAERTTSPAPRSPGAGSGGPEPTSPGGSTSPAPVCASPSCA